MKLINNEWDRDNLQFLLNTKGEDFQAFFGIKRTRTIGSMPKSLWMPIA